VNLKSFGKSLAMKCVRGESIGEGKQVPVHVSLFLLANMTMTIILLQAEQSKQLSILQIKQAHKEVIPLRDQDGKIRFWPRAKPIVAIGFLQREISSFEGDHTPANLRN